MALTIHENKEDRAKGNKITSDRRLYLNAARDQLVEEGPEARVLFCAKGRQVLRSEFERLGGKTIGGGEEKPAKKKAAKKKGG